MINSSNFITINTIIKHSNHIFVSFNSNITIVCEFSMKYCYIFYELTMNKYSENSSKKIICLNLKNSNRLFLNLLLPVTYLIISKTSDSSLIYSNSIVRSLGSFPLSNMTSNALTLHGKGTGDQWSPLHLLSITHSPVLKGILINYRNT